MTDNAHLKQIAKSTQVGYALSWNKQLNFNMGWYSWYLTGRQYYSAFAKLYDSILQVTTDRRKRVFIGDKKKNTINDTLRAEYDSRVMEFKQLFGLEQDPTGKMSYLDLRAVEKPDPKTDRVYISRKVPFELAWGRYSSPYIVFKAAFAFQVIEYVPTQYGSFPQQRIVPMIKRDDGSTFRQWTNCIPYVLWQEQSRKVLAELLPVAKHIETIHAIYLHNEGESKYVPDEVEGIAMDFDNENTSDNSNDSDEEIDEL